MDSFVLKALVNEIKSWCPVIIGKVVQPDADTIWIKIKGKGKPWIVICTRYPLTGLYMRAETPHRGYLETPLSLTLAKTIVGGEFVEINVADFDRVVKFEIIPRKAGHRLQKHTLIAELIGHRAGLFFIDDETQIILASNRFRHERNRNIFPGEFYEPLPSISKPDPHKMTFLEFKDLLLKRDPNEGLSVFLVKNLAGLSPQIAEEVIFRAGLHHHSGSIADIHIDPLWKALRQIFSEYGTPNPHPVVVIYDNPGFFPTLSTFPLESKIAEGKTRTFTTMGDAAECFYQRGEQVLLFKEEKAVVGRVIRNAQKKFQKRLSSLERDLDMLKLAEKFKKFGDILMANIHLVSRGSSDITLPDLFQEGEMVTIPLDPAKNAVQNAQTYFKKYKKAKRGLAFVQERKEETEAVIRKLNEAEVFLEKVQDSGGLKEIASFLEGVVPGQGKKTAQEMPSHLLSQAIKRKKVLKGVRSFKTEEGWEILVGKTDKWNYYLTRDLAKPEDIWFHIYNAPGSHVVLKNMARSDQIPPQIIKKAASVAAFFSRQRGEKRVLVGYTRKKYVRKPKGMKPGQVLVYHQKTIFVEPSLHGMTPA